jgi:hypothetical protein
MIGYDFSSSIDGGTTGKGFGGEISGWLDKLVFIFRTLSLELYIFNIIF